VVGEPESVDAAPAAVGAAPALVASAAGVVVPDVVVVVVLPVVVPGFGLAFVTDEPDLLVPGARVDPADVRELLGVAGVVLAGFGVGAGGLLDEDDALGLGEGLGATAAGGALVGAPPDPNAKPMTLPGAGS
jgi:hypothetical protein